MRKYFVITILFSITMVLQMHSYGEAAYLITMKTGRAITADHYQVKGDTIVVFLEEGMLTFSTHEVESIQQDMSKRTAVATEPKAARQEEKRVQERKTETKDAKPKASAASNEEGQMKKKAEITERLEEAKKAYFEAKNKAEKDRAREKMVSISRELFNWAEGTEKGNKPSDRK
jgi:hypothetical protein